MVEHTRAETSKLAPAAAWCAAMLTFAIVVHHISMEARSVVIILWGFLSVPAAIIPVIRGGPYAVTGITVWLVTGWQALVYSGDMGGPYAHYLAAAPICLATLITSLLLFAVTCVRLLRAGRVREIEDSPQTTESIGHDLEGNVDPSRRM